MGLRLLLPLLLLWTPRTRGSALDPNGQHVCKDSRWLLWESGGGAGGGAELVLRTGRGKREEIMGL